MTEAEKALVKESVYDYYCLRYARAKMMMEFFEAEMLRLREELWFTPTAKDEEAPSAPPVVTQS